MTQIQLKPIRRQTTVTLDVTLTDNGTKISWPDLDQIKAFIYSDAQRVIAGPCSVEVDGEDDTILHCRYGAEQQQYLGMQKVVVTCLYAGQQSTYDKPAFTFVASTDQTRSDGTTIAEEEVDVDIDVSDVDSSILAGAIQAALDAAAAAREAAAHVPYIGENNHWYQWDEAQNEYVDTGVQAAGYIPYIGLNGNWYQYDENQGGYVDTGVQARGKSPYIGLNGNWYEWDDDLREYVDTGTPARGPKGDDGSILYPTFAVDAAMHLIMDTALETNRFELEADGHLTITV